MNRYIKNTILLLLLIVFIVSCSNSKGGEYQTTFNEQSKSKKQDIVVLNEYTRTGFDNLPKGSEIGLETYLENRTLDKYKKALKKIVSNERNDQFLIIRFSTGGFYCCTVTQILAKNYFGKYHVVKEIYEETKMVEKIEYSYNRVISLIQKQHYDFPNEHPKNNKQEIVVLNKYTSAAFDNPPKSSEIDLKTYLENLTSQTKAVKKIVSNERNDHYLIILYWSGGFHCCTMIQILAKDIESNKYSVIKEIGQEIEMDQIKYSYDQVTELLKEE